MVIKLNSPINLDIEAVIKSNPFTKGKRLKKDYLLYIIHCIMQQRASKDDEHLRKIGKLHGFVPLHSKILEGKIPNYYNYIDYLINAGIIECDESFVLGKVSKGYRLQRQFRGNDFKKVAITDFILCKKIIKDKPFSRKNKAVTAFSYLAVWFANKKLEIDEKAAINYVNEYEKGELQKINSNNSFSSLRKMDEKDHLFEKIRSYKLLISRIAEKDFFFVKDDTGNRLHTNLTNLPKALRQFVSYDGEALVSVDIKNSQPYMSIPLLGKEFWQSKIITEKPNLKKIHSELYKKIQGNKQIKNNIIKFVDSSKSLYSIDFQKHRFIKSVTSGYFYELLGDVFEKREGLNLGSFESDKRKRVKKMVLCLLFDDPKKFYNKLASSPFQIFKKTFPSVARIFELVKTWDYCDLAIVLQRIESFLLLERICGRVTKESPHIPIFTIHDSIVTTLGNEDYIKSVMKEELEKSIGDSPQFSIEHWEQKTNYELLKAA